MSDATIRNVGGSQGFPIHNVGGQGASPSDYGIELEDASGLIELEDGGFIELEDGP